MRKFVCAVFAAAVLSAFSACSDTSQQMSTEDYSVHGSTDSTTGGELNSDVVLTNSEPSIDVANETQPYGNENERSLCADDKDEIQVFCSDICRKWAKAYCGIEQTDFCSLVQYEPLGNYLNYSIENSTISTISYSDDAYLELTDLDFADGKATAKGIYKDGSGAYGEFIYTLADVGGKLILNDLALNAKGSLDNVYRLDFIQSPYPDFWSEGGGYSELEQYFNEPSSNDN